MTMNIDKSEKPLTFFEVLTSTLAAVFGVQSKISHERDFTRGTVLQFIIAGVLFTALFVAGLVLLVQLII